MLKTLLVSQLFYFPNAKLDKGAAPNVDALFFFFFFFGGVDAICSANSKAPN
jgi:hypothetical protein